MRDKYVNEDNRNFQRKKEKKGTLSVDYFFLPNKRFSFTPRLVNHLQDKFEWTDAIFKSESIPTIESNTPKYNFPNEIEDNKDCLFLIARQYTHRRKWILQKNFSVYPFLDYSNAKREDNLTFLVAEERSYIKEKMENLEFDVSTKFHYTNNIFDAFNSYRCYIEEGFIFKALIIDLDDCKFQGMILYEMIRNFERKFMVKETFVLGITGQKSGIDDRDTIIHNVRPMMSVIHKPIDGIKLEILKEFLGSL